MKAPAVARALALALATVLLASRAGAGTDEDEARAAMHRGAAALERGDAQLALSEYLLAKRLAPAANAPWFFAGDALERLGRWREAVENFEGYIAKDPTVSDAARVEERIATLRATHFPARVRVIADARGAEVSIDHGPARAPAPGPVELEPGRHHFDARAPSCEPATQDVELVGDTDAIVTLVLRPHPQGPPPPAHEPAPPAAASSTVPWRTVGWVAAGVGSAGFVTMLVLDGAVLGPKLDEYRRAADGGNIAARGLLGDVDALRRGILVGYATSAALAVAGVTVGLFGPRQRRVGLSPVVGPGSGGMSVAGTF